MSLWDVSSSGMLVTCLFQMPVMMTAIRRRRPPPQAVRRLNRPPNPQLQGGAQLERQKAPRKMTRKVIKRVNLVKKRKTIRKRREKTAVMRMMMMMRIAVVDAAVERHVE